MAGTSGGSLQRSYCALQRGPGRLGSTLRSTVTPRRPSLSCNQVWKAPKMRLTFPELHVHPSLVLCIAPRQVAAGAVHPLGQRTLSTSRKILVSSETGDKSAPAFISTTLLPSPSFTSKRTNIMFQFLVPFLLGNVLVQTHVSPWVRIFLSLSVLLSHET